MAGFLSSGFRVCREVGLIFVAGVAVAAGAELAARVLPSLAFPIPMETKLRQGGGNLRRLPVVKLNPNPIADYLGPIPKSGGLVVEQVQNLRCGKSPVLESEFEINPMRLFCIRSFLKPTMAGHSPVLTLQSDLLFHSFFLKPLSVTLPLLLASPDWETAKPCAGAH